MNIVEHHLQSNQKINQLSPYDSVLQTGLLTYKKAADLKSAVMGTLNTNDLFTDSSKIANNKMSTRRTIRLT